MANLFSGNASIADVATAFPHSLGSKQQCGGAACHHHADLMTLVLPAQT
jgi:hypothetical protein